MYRYTNSEYYNSEGYYDPTAGKVFAQIVREEKNKHKPVKILDKVQDIVHYPVPIIDFSQWYAAEYTRTHGVRTSKYAEGKPKKWGDPKRIRKYLILYLYAIKHCDDADFSPEIVAVKCGLGAIKGARTVMQIFSGKGDIQNLIDAWYYWNENIAENSNEI